MMLHNFRANHRKSPLIRWFARLGATAHAPVSLRGPEWGYHPYSRSKIERRLTARRTPRDPLSLSRYIAACNPDSRAGWLSICRTRRRSAGACRADRAHIPPNDLESAFGRGGNVNTRPQAEVRSCTRLLHHLRWSPSSASRGGMCDRHSSSILHGGGGPPAEERVVEEAAATRLTASHPSRSSRMSAFWRHQSRPEACSLRERCS